MSFFNYVLDSADTAFYDAKRKAKKSADFAKHVVVNHSGKAMTGVGITFVAIAAAPVVAGPIASAIGSTGLLGTTAAGKVISTLSGAALRKASLAALGGGSVAAGGGGVAAGLANVASGVIQSTAVTATATVAAFAKSDFQG